MEPRRPFVERVDTRPIGSAAPPPEAVTPLGGLRSGRTSVHPACDFRTSHQAYVNPTRRGTGRRAASARRRASCRTKDARPHGLRGGPRTGAKMARPKTRGGPLPSEFGGTGHPEHGPGSPATNRVLASASWGQDRVADLDAAAVNEPAEPRTSAWWVQTSTFSARNQLGRQASMEASVAGRRRARHRRPAAAQRAVWRRPTRCARWRTLRGAARGLRRRRRRVRGRSCWIAAIRDAERSADFAVEAATVATPRPRALVR
jgi:hypothetical protein